MNKALIIFVRNATLGKVKTRLAAKIGNEKALEIYIKLLKLTRQVASMVDCDKYVFATEILQDDTWKDFIIEQQADGDLGQKMSDAFKTVFEKGHDKVLIIGSDCPGLSSQIIDEAFTKLDMYDMVIGPAQDGGYYLLGMKKMYPEIFKEKTWSSEKVYTETVKNIEDLKLNFYPLAILTDVDEEKDIPLGWG